MEAIQARMRRDLEGARSFLIVADQIKSVEEIGNKNVEFAEQRLKANTPFYLLAYAVLDALEIDKQRRSGSKG